MLLTRSFALVVGLFVAFTVAPLSSAAIAGLAMDCFAVAVFFAPDFAVVLVAVAAVTVGPPGPDVTR